jgi:hypothetical protein
MCLINDKLMLAISSLLFVVWDFGLMCQFSDLGHCFVSFVFSYSLLVYVSGIVNFIIFLQ